MKIVAGACAVALLMAAYTAFAHAHLEKTAPADGSVLKASPPQFVLSFAKPVRITALWLQRGADAKQKVGPLPGTASAQISVPAPRLAAGRYVLSWSVVGEDGHVMPGKVSFTIDSPEGIAPAPGN